MPEREQVEQRRAEREERRRRNAGARRRWRERRKSKRNEARASQPPREPFTRPEHGPGRPKVRQGGVVSAKPDKTITVRIDVTRRNRAYKKIVRESSTLHAHDERND